MTTSDLKIAGRRMRRIRFPTLASFFSEVKICGLEVVMFSVSVGMWAWFVRLNYVHRLRTYFC